MIWIARISASIAGLLLAAALVYFINTTLDAPAWTRGVLCLVAVYVSVVLAAILGEHTLKWLER